VGGPVTSERLTKRPCEWCHGEGRIIKPCPLCGGLRVRDGAVVYETGSIWDVAEAADRPKLREPRRRARR